MQISGQTDRCQPKRDNGSTNSNIQLNFLCNHHNNDISEAPYAVKKIFIRRIYAVNVLYFRCINILNGKIHLPI